MMEGTIQNTGAPSLKVDETYAEGKAVAAHSKDQEPNFKSIDSLHSAVTGDVVHIEKFEEKVKELNLNPPDLHQILTPSGNTILHIYIISRPPKTAKLQKPTKKATQQEAEFVKKVLEMCPNLLLKANQKGETLLHFAARYGHDNIVKELLEECKKPLPDYKDQENGVETKRWMAEKTNESKDTAMHEAVRYNHIDVVNRLIKADTEVKYDANESGETPLYLAAERGYTNVVEEILNQCKSAADHGPMGRTALHAAVIRRDKDIAAKLLQKKQYLSSQKDERGRFALHYAAFLGYDEIVETLLEKYPSAAYQDDNDGMTALLLAAGNGQEKAVKKLIERCPNCCELLDKRGRNALHLALTSADDSTIKIFLNDPALGNLINQKDKEGNTPLLQLATSGSDKSTFIDHHKVDKLVFNKENKNAEDIILAKDLIMDDQEMFLWRLKRTKEWPCRRIILPKQEVREGKVNQPSSISIRKVNYGKAKDERGEDVKKQKEERSENNMKQKGDGSEDTKKTNDDGSEEIIEIIKGAEETHLVAATLIATVTFAAGFTLPGGYIGEGNPNEGTALLTRSAAFQAFVIFDTTAFALSCAAVLIHLTMGLHKDKTQLFKQFKKELKLTSFAMVAMVFAFVTGIYAVLYPDKSLAITSSVIGCLFGAYFSKEANKDVGKFIEKQQGLSNLKGKRRP